VDVYLDGEGNSNLLIDKLFIASLAATWMILFYHVILTFGGYRHFVKTLTSAEPEVQLDEYPMVTILIPAHNEEMVIGRTIDAMARLIYPQDRLEIIVVNDCSTDRTGTILARKCEIYPQLKVVTLVPPHGAKGKSNALNHGLAISQGEYVVVYDADNTPERRAVLYLVNAIVQDAKLGAVVGKFRTRNKDVNLLTRFINVETLSFQWLLQAGRCHFFGITTIPGTNFIIRRSLLDIMGGWNINALTEDTELTIRIYDYGYRIYWLPHAVTWEQEPETLSIWMKQRTRWAQGNMWIIGHYLLKLFTLKDLRIGADIIYFTCTYFVFFVAIIVSDTIFILGILGLAKLTVSGPFGIIWLLAYVLFIAETYISLSLERGEGDMKNLAITALMYFTYSQLWIILVFKASYLLIKRMFLRKTGFHWYKTERSSR
jgi:cellulose synthase/poly-beta-1,6-N-acetylglucosamine synthase-like glycosyltransferase